MAKSLMIRINDSAYRRLMAKQKGKDLQLSDLVAYLVNQERKSELQKESDSRNGKKGGNDENDF